MKLKAKGGDYMKRLIRKDDGSITLEAAMILPFFMLFIVFLATLIRISVADMALYKAAAETNEIVVAHAYPAEVIRTGVEDFAKNKVQSVLPGDLEVDHLTEWGNQALEFFGVDAGASIANYLETLAEESILQPILQDKFEQAAGDTFFNSDNLEVTNVILPSLAGGSGGDYFQIEVTYEIPISIPFVNRSIILSKTASERLWTGS